MIEIGIGLASFVGARSIKTALEKLDPSSIDNAGYRFGHGAVGRREVASLFRRAYAQGMDILRRRCVTQVQEQIGEGSPESEAVLAAFGRLRELGKLLFVPEEAKTTAHAERPPVLDEVLHDLLEAAAPIPKPVGRIVLKHFGNAFSFTFHQVTVRADDATWARIHHALVNTVKKSFEVPEDRIQKLSDRLNRLDSLLERSETFRSFETEFQEDITAVLPRAETQIRTMADIQGIAELAPDPNVEVPTLDTSSDAPRGRAKRDEKSPVRAYVVVRDEKGKQVTSYALKDGVTTVGRTEENSLQLADLTVSSRHALIRVVTEDSGSTTVVLRDLGSTNGTFFITKKGPRQVREVKLAFGDSVSLGGAFSAEIVSPEDHGSGSAAAADPNGNKKGLMGRIFRR